MHRFTFRLFTWSFSLFLGSSGAAKVSMQSSTTMRWRNVTCHPWRFSLELSTVSTFSEVSLSSLFSFARRQFWPRWHVTTCRSQDSMQEEEWINKHRLGHNWKPLLTKPFTHWKSKFNCKLIIPPSRPPSAPWPSPAWAAGWPRMWPSHHKHHIHQLILHKTDRRNCRCRWV